ncbi:DEAD box RNA helicase CiRH59 [Haematococcus lacustris]|uniref:RNA helicase n=1 Tax=Haematococcus lacustris TaxID=44745 RepID=A0A699Y930_HAELA|nr:DEAD box RNA helicase CiRH59 [Haematococcus lacustris]
MHRSDSSSSINRGGYGNIAHHKYETPTPIQCQGIPIALSGSDILGCAETGSGKTASFAIPMIHHCLQQKPLRPGDGPIALVLAPTRELAQQIEKEIKAFARTSGRAARSCIVVGGVHMAEQRHELKSGVEVVVATPGRFIDHLQQGNTNLDRISFVVLDEADRMLDMGFEPQVRGKAGQQGQRQQQGEIKEVMGRLPLRHQTLLFSATMPREIEGLAQAYLNNPITVKVGAVSTPTANVAQSLESCPDVKAKMELLIGLLSKEMELANSGGPPMCLTVVFVERKIRCDEVAEALRYEDIPAVALHGGLTQGEREAALRDFAAGLAKVLVATDVASRGLDIKGIGHVVNMDLPKTFEDYVHRIGRTGRAGTRGRATSFYTERDSFLVTQIKTALSEVAKGNNFAFASGKAARQEERQLAAAFK